MWRKLEFLLREETFLLISNTRELKRYILVRTRTDCLSDKENKEHNVLYAKKTLSTKFAL
jgi:hypothetical protein